MFRGFVTAAAVLTAAVVLDSANATQNWPLHNSDLRNTRYSSLDQINAANAGTLALKWS